MPPPVAKPMLFFSWFCTMLADQVAELVILISSVISLFTYNVLYFTCARFQVFGTTYVNLYGLNSAFGNASSAGISKLE